MEKFYTANQRDILRERANSPFLTQRPISEATGAVILDALGEQQNTLQNIQDILQRIAEGVNREPAQE